MRYLLTSKDSNKKFCKYFLIHQSISNTSEKAHSNFFYREQTYAIAETENSLKMVQTDPHFE